MHEGARQESASVSWFAALLATTATYVYFLIFAEFAFLELVRAIAPNQIRTIMAALGAAGIAGALLAAKSFTVQRQTLLLAGAFRGSALGAALALFAPNLLVALAAAIITGISLGALTVCLSSALLSATSGVRLGLCIGTGTGVAYAGCNVPLLFHASPASQTLVAAVIAGAASFVPRWMIARPVDHSTKGEHGSLGLARWVVVLLALVWMDSAAFYIVQHTAELRSWTWSSSTTLFANATVHLVAAIAAGALLDRSARSFVAATATLALIAACLMLNGVLPTFVTAAWCYTLGVSLYSVVLVEYPARSGRPQLAAIVFAIAGWLGSAFGIGMAQDLEQIPVAFVVAAAVAIAASLLSRRLSFRRLAPALALAIVLTPRRTDAQEAEKSIALGREVYIAEGCIHCHSQYVRPQVPLEVERWGPAVSLTDVLAESPPLIGVRRQGPDLLRVGNRRSAEWNRLHLIDPCAVSPGSRMPAYSHLFAGSGERGIALITYLASLGADTFTERQTQIARWIPDARHPIPAPMAQHRFLQLCANCHGERGHGDGVLAGKLSYRPPDWRQMPWRHVPADADLETTLSRIIKFGLPGLPMAGHEYLPDRDVVGLARFVQTLHKEGRDATPVALQP